MALQRANTAAGGPSFRRAMGKRRWTYLGPIAVFGIVAIAFTIGLTMDPSIVPTVLVDKPVPEFELPPVKGRRLGLSRADIDGEVSLVNVFASWCAACRDEHPLLMQLAQRRVVPIHGLNYKDKPDDAQAWLDTLGDPYTRTGADLNGRVAIEWGVYGVPETFVIDANGRIAHKHIGALNPKSLEEMILPLVRKLRQPGS